MPYSTETGVKIYYDVTGEGAAMVLIHANTFDHNLWLYQIAHFSTWFRVIAVDIRGYGRSDKVIEPYSLDDMVNDVIGVCRKESVDKAVFGGISVGSGIAILLGLDRPELADALILVGGASARPEGYEKRIEGYEQSGVAAYQRGHMEDCVAPGFAQTRLGNYLLDIFTERGARLDGKAIGRVFRARGDAHMTPRLGAMTVPTLVVNGAYDMSLEAGRETASLIPGAWHRVLPGTGHVCNIEDPAGFDAAVIEFLEHRGLMPPL